MDEEYWQPRIDSQMASFRTALPIVLEWFEARGGTPIQDFESDNELHGVELGNIQYFFGPPTATLTESFGLIEIAALIYEFPPFDESSLRAMADGIPLPAQMDDPLSFIDFHDEGLWSVVRLLRSQLRDPEVLDGYLSTFVSGAERLHGAVH